MTLDEIKQASPFAIGEENVNYAQYFDGKSYLNGLSLQQVYVGNVTFEPGCRNHWHIHHAKSGGGQILIVTAGRGWYQESGKRTQGRRCRQHPAGSQALARRSQRQCLPASGRRGAGRRDEQRMVRARRLGCL